MLILLSFFDGFDEFFNILRKTRLKTRFECMTVRFIKRLSETFRDFQRLSETFRDFQRLFRDFQRLFRDFQNSSWIRWSTMNKTSTSWKRWSIWCFQWSIWTKVATTRTTRTTRTIFKLVGPCEILSRSKIYLESRDFFGIFHLALDSNLS